MKSVLQTRIAPLVATVVISFSAIASDEGRGAKAENTPYDLRELAWLTGYWVGDGFGGTCEEIWSKPSAGSMVGSFKLSVDGTVRFYEIFTLTIDSAGLPTLRIKHFNADLTGWEEKDKVVVFSYETATDSSLTIGAVTYRRLAADSLHIDVRLKNKSGKLSVETLKLARMPL